MKTFGNYSGEQVVKDYYASKAKWRNTDPRKEFYRYASNAFWELSKRFPKYLKVYKQFQRRMQREIGVIVG